MITLLSIASEFLILAVLVGGALIVFWQGRSRAAGEVIEGRGSDAMAKPTNSGPARNRLPGTVYEPRWPNHWTTRELLIAGGCLLGTLVMPGMLKWVSVIALGLVVYHFMYGAARYLDAPVGNPPDGRNQTTGPSAKTAADPHSDWPRERHQSVETSLASRMPEGYAADAVTQWVMQVLGTSVALVVAAAALFIALAGDGRRYEDADPLPLVAGGAVGSAKSTESRVADGKVSREAQGRFAKDKPAPASGMTSRAEDYIRVRPDESLAGVIPRAGKWFFEQSADTSPLEADANNRIRIEAWLVHVVEKQYGISLGAWVPDAARMERIAPQLTVEAADGTQFFGRSVELDDALVRSIHDSYLEEQGRKRSIPLLQWFGGAVLAMGGLGILLRLGTGQRSAVPA